MKTLKVISKGSWIITLFLVAFMLSIEACKEDDPEPVQGVVEADLPEFAVVNVPVAFLDKSDDATSREWTIQDGTPATSTEKSVSVTFSSAGSKSVTLSVVFDNGTTNSATFTVDVAEELNASISSEETVDIVDNDIEVSVTFEATVVGDPDGYNWTFPGGSPETSTEANPTVVWVGGGMSDVSLTITRSADNASLEVSETIQVGPENLWTDEFWGFEGEEVIATLQTWDGDAGGPWGAGVLAALNNGYEGKGIEINYPGNTGYYGVISRDITTANASLKLGDIVLFSYYAKVAADGSAIGFSRIVNHCPSWWEGNPPAGFEGFTADQAQDYQYYCNVEPVDAIGTEWTRISTIDTLESLNYADGLNVFPEFGFGGDPAVFSIDKVELKLLGNLND